MPNSLFAQEEQAQVRRLKRSIFVYNISEQVTWPYEEELDAISIGVLGPDRTSIDLKAMALNRSIKGKPVVVKRFNKVKDIDDIQVLYVNNKFNFDILYILNSTAGKNILIITEDYTYNSSMINMVSVGNSFEYEINKDLLSKEFLITAPSLARYAITSEEKWKELYKDASENLQKEKQVVEIKTNQISDRDTIIEDQKEALAQGEATLRSKEVLLQQKNDSIQRLWSLSELQQENFEDKLLIEKELEAQIDEQLEFAKEQQKQIDERSEQIADQEGVLELQAEELQKRQNILIDKDQVIKDQRNINLLLGVIVGLLLLGGLLLYRIYRKKVQLVKELEEKNFKIEKQAVLLLQKNAEVEQFAYIASHDLQEPLNTVTSLVTVLLEDYKDKLDEVGVQCLEYMSDSSHRMSSLIRGLLSHAKLGNMDASTQVNCDVLLTEVLQDMSTRIRAANASVEKAKLPIVHASEMELRLVFQNLISNAIKFAKEDVAPIIHVDVKESFSKINPTEKVWEFSISDNGIGIPKLYQERIFAIFQRLHSREAYEGTGIGLAHVKKIVNAHGGTIWLTSEEGIGSTFYFTIPR